MDDFGKAETVVNNWRLDKWFPDLSQGAQSILKTYREELVKFNKVLNLISLKTVPHADAVHFSDSILAAKMIFPEIKTGEIYDFGSGSGFPGLVFAALKSDLKVFLVDSDQRKCEFLKHVAATTKLGNVTVLNSSVESLKADTVQYAVSRGYAPIARSLLSCRKVFKLNGVYFHMKSDEWANELADMPTQLCSVWRPDLLGVYDLPVGDVSLAIVKTEKIKA